jgi:hypothetical protein
MPASKNAQSWVGSAVADTALTGGPLTSSALRRRARVGGRGSAKPVARTDADRAALWKRLASNYRARLIAEMALTRRIIARYQRLKNARDTV